LGNLYQHQGKLKEAEEIYQRVLAGEEKALGPDHISTLNSIHNLGILYSDQGKLKEAEEMYQLTLTGYGNILGPSHRYTQDAMLKLEDLQFRSNRQAGSQNICLHTSEGSREEPMPDHN